jgi:hypothetical protein
MRSQLRYEKPKLINLTSESWETPLGFGSLQTGCGDGQADSNTCSAGPYVGKSLYCTSGSNPVMTEPE